MGRKVFDLIVPNGATTSNVLSLAFIYSLSIQGPTGLAEVATVQVSNDGLVWDTLDPASVTVAADNIEEISTSSAFMRISLGGAAAAERIFIVSAVEYRV